MGDLIRWTIRINDLWFDGFPAKPDDTEAEVRRKVEIKVHEYLLTEGMIDHQISCRRKLESCS